MTFISYAQNFEDIMLWRALKHVDKGFYIDVGANDPSTDSVTKAFYERGWHGINIEPLPSHHADLVRDRPRDINLQCAVGASQGEVDLWEYDVRGWATASAEVAAQHEAAGHAGSCYRVEVTTLSSICEQFATGDINFLKIDVEGFEKAVIEGMDFSRFRPWVLIIEATKPNSTIEIHNEWEGAILAADYTFAYGDGLNRFYLAHEHAALLPLLRYPPNVFDGYVLSRQITAQENAQQAEARAQQAEARAQQAEARAQQAESMAQQAQSRIEALLNSTSWRWTAPLRWVSRHMGSLREKNLPGHAKALAKHRAGKTVRRAMVFLDTKPRLRALCRNAARKAGITSYLRALFFGISSPAPATSDVRDTVPASIRMMLDVDKAIRTAEVGTSIIYLESR